MEFTKPVRPGPRKARLPGTGKNMNNQKNKENKTICKVTMFVIQMKNALRGLSAPAAWQTPEKFFI